MKKKCRKKFSKKFFSKKKNFFCENEKSNYPRFLGDFYYHGTMNIPCISEMSSICNWVTFCGPTKYNNIGTLTEQLCWDLFVNG